MLGPFFYTQIPVRTYIHSLVAETSDQPRRAGTLLVLEAPEQQKHLTVGKFATPEPGSGLWPHLGATDPAPAVFSFLGEFAVTGSAGCLFGKQLAHQLLTPGFARNVC